MRDVALVGLPFSGKTTVFNAVSRQHAATGTGGAQAHLAVVEVPDPRLERLRELLGSQEAAHARVRLVDVPGLDARALAEAREADALACVLRAFGDEADPAADLERFRAELAVTDLGTIERALDRLRRQAKSGDEKVREELEAVEHAEAVLSEDRWLAEESWSPDAYQALALLTPLTLKPVLWVLNLDETGTVPTGAPEPATEIRGLLEAEAAELDPSEAAEFMAEYGLEESATDRFVRSVYGLLDLVTFFTANEQEAHAWEVPRGTRAPQAAGTIHSDFERGFVRAETVSYSDLVAAGSWDAAREGGTLRIEGKEYEVQDGDVIQIRHTK